MTALSPITRSAIRPPSSAVSGGRLERGASGAAVTELQQLLKAAGLYGKSVGGQFGPGTEAAVKAFQRNNGLTVDGWAGPQTMAKLRQQVAQRQAPPPTSGGRLMLGASGPEVRDLQLRLSAQGYFNGATDGAFGPSTEAAVRAFQRANRLTVDGWAGPQTMGRLRPAPTTPSAPPTPSSPAPPAPGSPPPTSPTPPSGALIPPNSRVLLVGDSHTRGQFGLSLERQLRGKGMSVSTYASGGRNARHWVNGHVSAGNGFRISSDTSGVNEGGTGSGRHRFEPLEEIIRRERPSVLVMADGTNMLNAGGSAAIATVKALAQQYGVKLIWVGPPEMRKFNTEESFYRALRANLGSSIPVIDSRPATAAAAAAGYGDGVHYFDNQSRTPATDWALAVARTLTGS